MKKLLRTALAVVYLLVCSSAQAADVLFDVTSTNASAYTSFCGQTCNVTLQNKTFSAYEWDGAVFPFTASQAVLDATFGEGKWDLQEFDSFDGTTIKMKAATSIVAGTPYAIRVKQTIENPIFNNVTFASSISTNYIKVTLSNDLQFWGTYFKTPWYSIVNGQGNPVTALSFKSDGSGLGNWRPNQETFRVRDISGEGYYGIFAWFYHPTLNTTTPSLSYDGISSGSGSGGGGDEPTPTSLEGKIAARAQITNVPTIYIDLPGIGDQTLDEYLYKKVGSDTTPEEAPYRPAKIQVVATSDTSSPHYLESFTENAIDANGNTNLEIKVRGNSTAKADKRPYRLKFASKKTSTDGKAHKHDLLGYGYAKRNWTLLANVNDKSLLRNALTYHIGKAVGMPFCPGYKFVDLVINNEYRGTYQVSDHCEVDIDRINVNADTGWYVEFQGRNDMCDYPMCFAEGGVLMNINNPEPDDENDADQRAAIINPMKDWFLNTWKKAFGAGYSNPATGWRTYNDEETLLKFWIATELTGDYDGLMSVKAYREADGKLCWGPLWDKDLAFGNWDSMAAPDGKLVANLKQASCVQGYFENLTKDPTFMAHAKETLDNLIGGGIKTTLLAKIDEMADVVRETQKLNHDKWGDHPSGAFGHVDGLADYQAYVDQLKEWLSDRIDYVQERFAELVVEANKVTGSLTLDAAKSQADNGITVDIQDKLYNVTLLNKTFEKGKWSAISLPFAVNEQTLKSVFGDQYELKELAGIYSNGTTLYFATPANNAIIPGMPYLIKPSKVVAANPVFNGVMLAYCPDWTNNHKAYGESVTFGNYTFSANLYLNSLNVDGTDLLIGGDAASFTFPQKANSWDTTGPVYGLNAYIRKADGAENPAISFQEETPVETTELIDGEPYTYTENTTVESVAYTRKFNNGGLKAWFVPFDYTITDNDAEKFIFYDINMIAASPEIGGEVTDENAMYIYIVKMKAGNKLQANTPYLIKPLAAYPNGYTFNLENAELKAPETGSTLHLETRANKYDFYGCYDQFTPTTNGEVYWMGAKGSLGPSLANTTMKSYRWYIKVTSKTSNSAKVNFIIEEYDSDATGITTTKAGNEPESYFSPNGIQLEKPMKGLNIIKMKDGTIRKVIVK